MNIFNLKLNFYVFLLISTFFFVHVLTLHEEGVIGGILAVYEEFKFQVAILGLSSDSEPKLLGGGAIIAEKFILTAAHCFINSSSGDILQFSFSVRLATLDLNSTAGLLVDIDRINFAKYNPKTRINDLAVVELKTSLNLDVTPMLEHVELPQPGESFINMHGKIAGYGYTWITLNSSSPTGTTGGTDSRLRYGELLILLDIVCIDLFGESYNTEKQICCASKIQRRNVQSGVCELDGGSPLVIKNKIVAILSQHHYFCDDSTFGALYTKVSAFTSFIQVSALHGEGILGGEFADPFQFMFAAAIVGMNSEDSEPELLGGGAIIADKFILTAAHCFINSSGNISDLSFLVRLATIDIKSVEGLLLDIDKIHFAEYDHQKRVNDLALVELVASLNLKSNTYLRKIWLPRSHQSFANREGIILGYGYTWTVQHLSSSNITHGGTEGKLKYIDVQLLFDVICMDLIGDTFDPEKQNCGVTRPTNNRSSGGLCKLDGGGPLIVERRIVAILSKYNPTCDDTTTGAIYTKVPAFMDFINGVTAGEIEGVTVHHNQRFEVDDIPLI